MCRVVASGRGDEKDEAEGEKVGRGASRRKKGMLSIWYHQETSKNRKEQ